MSSVFFDLYTTEDANQTIIEPVTEDMVKNDMKVEESFDANTAVIGTYITTARNMIEDHINNIIVSRKFTTIRTGYIQSVHLKTPVISITSVKVTDLSDIEITLDVEDYVLIHQSGICQLDLDYQVKKIEVNYRSGMDTIPFALQQACLKIIRELYANAQIDLTTMKELDTYRSLNI